MVLLAMLVAIPVMAQQTNDFKGSPEKERSGIRKNRSNTERARRSEITEEQRNERKYKFMDDALTKIGVSEEDRIKIHAIQEAHRKKMKDNSVRVSAARKKLSELQRKSASVAELDAVIDEISAAQAEQLKILVRNRLEMEQLLGQEKYKNFMDSARMQFRKHGRPGGHGMPPRPGMPPIPGRTDGGDNKPPLPPHKEGSNPPPPES